MEWKDWRMGEIMIENRRSRKEKKRKIGEREWKWISVAYETLGDPLNLSERKLRMMQES